MDKQHFDHIENRIRQAAENVSPPFREDAWKNMEALLDRELNKKRRGIIWWWPLMLFVVLGGSGLIYYFNDHGTEKRSDHRAEKPAGGQLTQPAAQSEIKHKTNELKAVKPQDEQSDKAPTTPQVAAGNTIDKITVPASGEQKVHPDNKDGNEPEQTGRTGKVVYSSKRQTTRLSTGNGLKQGRPSAESPLAKNRVSPNNVVSGSPGNNVPVPPNSASVTPKNNESVTSTQQPDPKTPAVEKNPSIAESKADSPVNTPDKNKTKENTANVKNEPAKKSRVKLDEPRPRLYFTASLAADASNIDKLSADNRGTVYGAGIGYHITRRLGLQTGFYASKKLYTAGPGDYKIQPGSYWSMVDLMSVDADCMIYEIPLSMRFDIIQGNRFNMYSTGGLSSIIMKKETYGYHYKRSGVDHWAERTYTGNKHFLSVVDLSLGIEHKILPAFYLQAEPYIKLPVAGIGDGKVKLYSAGVQVGIKYQPIRKKKNK